nr:UbiA prenyltransferase [Boreostereum vibrans]
MSSATTPLMKKEGASPQEKVAFPLGFFSPKVRPYLELIRLHKPTGTILMFWPFAWGLTLAAYKTDLPLHRYWVELAKSAFIAELVRGSACTINDIFDRKFDAGVERSRGRPLPSGRVTVFGAVVYLVIQYLIGIVFYSTYPNTLSIYAGLFQLLPLFLIYPLMKRITYFPQAWLGIAMNFSLVVGWASITGSLDYQLLLVLLAGAWGWTMHYDTIYACQDRRDDVKVGVKSTAVFLGDYVGPVCFALAMMFVGTLYYAGILNGQSHYYFLISVGGSAAHIVYQYAVVDLDSPPSCGRFFDQNGHMGLITWAGMMLDYLVKIDALPFKMPF